MEATIDMLPSSIETKDKKTSIRKVMLVCVLFYVGLFVSFYVNLVSVLLLFLSFYVVLFFPEDKLFCFLLFAFPFATVFKIEGINTSLFTIVEVLAVIRLYVKNKKIEPCFIVPVLAFSIVSLISISQVSGMIEIVKVLLAFLLLYSFSKGLETKDAKLYFGFYLCSIILSTLMGLFRGTIPGLTRLVPVGKETWIGDVGTTLHSTMRFSGLNKDPNYYSLLILPAIVVLFSAVFTEKGNKRFIYGLLFLVISVFGVLTLSKSFILVYSFVVVSLLLSHFKKHPAFSLFVVLFLIITVFINPFGVFSDLALRLDGLLGASDLNSVTTGRVDIWRVYLEAINESPISVLFGHGIDAGYPKGAAAHNLYLEGVYKTGLFGLVMFVLTYISIFFRGNSFAHSPKIRDFLPLGVCLSMYFFLAGFTGYELTFYLMISYACLKCGLSRMV